VGDVCLWPISAAPVVRLRVCYSGSSCRAGCVVGEAVHDPLPAFRKSQVTNLGAEINLAIQLKSGTIFWPMQRIMKRIKNGLEDGIYAYGVVMLRS
jgi:hypothetical protein